MDASCASTSLVLEAVGVDVRLLLAVRDADFGEADDVEVPVEDDVVLGGVAQCGPV